MKGNLFLVAMSSCKQICCRNNIQETAWIWEGFIISCRIKLCRTSSSAFLERPEIKPSGVILNWTYRCKGISSSLTVGHSKSLIGILILKYWWCHQKVLKNSKRVVVLHDVIHNIIKTQSWSCAIKVATQRAGSCEKMTKICFSKVHHNENVALLRLSRGLLHSNRRPRITL